MKTNGALPQVGHAAVNKPAPNMAKNILVDFFIFVKFRAKIRNIKKIPTFAANFIWMKKTYKVAGNKFSVEMPDDSSFWDVMPQYDLFLDDDSGEHVFDLTLVDEIPATEGLDFVVEDNIAPEYPVIRVYDAGDDGWVLTMSPRKDKPISVYLSTDKHFSKSSFCVVENPNFSVNKVIVVLFAESTARRNTVLMHSSVTMNDGKGYLFLGKSGTGKSTHSQLWINNIEDCELLNDDHPALRVESDGTVRVYGTPWSGKTPCYRNLNVPVGAIVDLHQAKENAISRLPLPTAYGVIYKAYSGFRCIKEHADGHHATVEKIVTTVPCYSLHCLPDAEAALLCHQTVLQP